MLIPVSITSSTSWVKKRRFTSLEEWFVEPQDDDAGVDFYTLLQAGFYRAYECRGIQLSKHSVLDYRRLRQVAGGANIEEHFTYLRGLAELLLGQADMWSGGPKSSMLQFGSSKAGSLFSSCSEARSTNFPGKKLKRP
jgi:hypothetical protein